MSILLIAGHGDGDPGAIGCGRKECDLTRDFVEILHQSLLGSVDHYVYDFSRNCYKDCKNNYAPDWTQFDYVLEVHFNASNGNGSGTEILVHDGVADTELEAEIIQAVTPYGLINRGIKYRDNLLIMNSCNRAGVKYALLEICFINNLWDVGIYDLNKTRIANSIAYVLMDYFGSIVPPPLYRVQTGAFKSKANAESLANELGEKGYDTYIIKSDGLYKVQTGAYLVKDNAKRMSAQLKADGYDNFVTEKGIVRHV